MPVNASSLTRISVDSGGTSANNVATGGVMSADGRYVVFQSTATNLVGGDLNGFFDVFLRDTVTGTTTLLSTATGGTQGNNVSSVAAITDDGRFVFFNSTATNLVGGDTNAALDVFMRDTLTGVTTRVSTASDGSQANGASQNVDVTGNGAFIGFQSTATNLVAGDSNGFSDVFVKNLSTGLVTRVSVADDESQANGNSLVARLSDDGNRASFVSTASNLTANDTNGAVTDIFVRDIAAGTTTLASVSTVGGSGDGQSSGASISGNGRYVVFQSDATNLVAGDTNGTTDVFVRDLQTNTTTRVSTATDGSQSNDLSGQAVISADGRYVVFFSLASNLVQGDTNGLRDIFLKDMVTGNVTRLSVAADGSELNDLSNTPSISADGRYVTFQTQATDTGVGAEGNGTGFDVFRISLAASAGADRMIGSDGNDSIDGLAGDDIITGGFGNDTLTGGAGADSLDGGGGTDTVDYSASSAAVSVDLVAGTGASGDAQGDTVTGFENAIGSAFNDSLTGTGTGTLNGLAGNDILSGGTTLNGGTGNDTLLAGASAETLDGGADSDTVSYAGAAAGVTVDLGSGTTGGGASGDALFGIENLKGSIFADVLTGTAGDNILNDGGVGGSDTLTGGGGNDSYSVYNAGAVIVEVGGEGVDRVNAGVNYVLASGVSAEYLNTTSLNATYAVNLTGNEFVQLVRGNDGANVLDGAGGDDWLWGMGGADTFSFSTALGAGNVDRIADFSVTDDQIQLDSAIFTALGVGALDASAFKDSFLGPRDADDRIFYNSNTGSLFYDADGTGNDFTAVKFAMLVPGLALTAADFTVI
ncbi:beta strand repeat-containing protein [Mesorhizobium sp. IMUNJ 23232]|uniref:beta strand repeat-containing protein n=1 Tax=Mesorhizobium sp. IMUNJ 23232 TaxID=3376064 RepID=UPI00378C3EA5